MSPKEIVEKWVEAFNRVDVEALGDYYHDDAVNHQMVFGPIVGKKAIKEMFCREFAKARMVCLVENIFQDGQWAILEWSDPLGLRGCGFFQVLDGKIELQRGYWDQLSFLRIHGLPLPDQ